MGDELFVNHLKNYTFVALFYLGEKGCRLILAPLFLPSLRILGEVTRRENFGGGAF